MAIDAQMQKVVKNMEAVSQQISTASQMNGGRPWMNFVDVEKAGKFEFDKVHKIFDRTQSNTDYARLKTQKGAESKELQTSKLSGDFLAGCERDYRMRTRSRVRMFVHCGVVLPEANTSPDGPLEQNTIGWLGRVLSEAVK